MSTPPPVPETREEMISYLKREWIPAYLDWVPAGQIFYLADIIRSLATTARAEGHAAGREEALTRANHDEVVELLDVLQRHGTHQNSCAAGLEYFLWTRRRHPVAPVEVFDERSG